MNLTVGHLSSITIIGFIVVTYPLLILYSTERNYVSVFFGTIAFLSVVIYELSEKRGKIKTKSMRKLRHTSADAMYVDIITQIKPSYEVDYSHWVYVYLSKTSKYLAFFSTIFFINSLTKTNDASIGFMIFFLSVVCIVLILSGFEDVNYIRIDDVTRIHGIALYHRGRRKYSIWYNKYTKSVEMEDLQTGKFYMFDLNEFEIFKNEEKILMYI